MKRILQNTATYDTYIYLIDHLHSTLCAGLNSVPIKLQHADAMKGRPLALVHHLPATANLGWCWGAWVLGIRFGWAPHEFVYAHWLTDRDNAVRVDNGRLL